MVGSPRYVRSSGADVPDHLAAAESEVLAAGATPVLAALDGRCVAVIGLADPIRDDVSASLAELEPAP